MPIFSAEDLEKVLLRLRENDPTLTRVNFLHALIGDKGAIALAKALAHNTKLTRLELHNNRISNEGAIALAEMLKNNKSLKYLDLDFNAIGPESASNFAEALKHNTTLNSLFFDYNRLGEEGTTVLAGVLNYNTTLTQLGLHNNNGLHFSMLEKLVDAPLKIRHKQLEKTMESEAFKMMLRLRAGHTASTPVPLDIFRLVLQEVLFDSTDLTWEACKKIISHIEFLLSKRRELSTAERNKGEWLQFKDGQRRHFKLTDITLPPKTLVLGSKQPSSGKTEESDNPQIIPTNNPCVIQ